MKTLTEEDLVLVSGGDAGDASAGGAVAVAVAGAAYGSRMGAIGGVVGFLGGAVAGAVVGTLGYEFGGGADHLYHRMMSAL